MLTPSALAGMLSFQNIDTQVKKCGCSYQFWRVGAVIVSGTATKLTEGLQHKI